MYPEGKYKMLFDVQKLCVRNHTGVCCKVTCKRMSPER
jgi:hypothetical protein